MKIKKISGMEAEKILGWINADRKVPPAVYPTDNPTVSKHVQVCTTSTQFVAFYDYSDHTWNLAHGDYKNGKEVINCPDPKYWKPLDPTPFD